jgi:putative DNA primase/helicase
MELIREGTDRVVTLGNLTFVVHGIVAESAGIRASLTIRRGADVLARDCVPLWSPRRRKDLTAAFTNGEAEQVERALIAIEAALSEEHARQDSTEERRALVTDTEPWPEPVDGAKLLGTIEESLRRFVVLMQSAYTAVALWVVAAHALKVFDLFPMLAAISPVKRCGKTTLLSVLARLLPRPLATSNISTASVYRAIEECGPSLLMDEADTFARDNPELRGVLNSGHSRDLAFVVRTVEKGEEQQPARFSTWCPKVVAAIGKLPETWEDRSIVIPMRRRAKGETVERARRKVLEPLRDVGRMAARWAEDHAGDLADAAPVIPDELDDRAADNWEPILAVADLVGGSWPERARKAALTLSAGRDAEDEGAGVRLLRNIGEVFSVREADRVPSADLVEALLGEPEWGWGTWRKGRPLDQRGLAKLLKPFGIRSKAIWLEGRTVRGFERGEFVDAWVRYGAFYPQAPQDLNNGKGLGQETHPQGDFFLADRKLSVTPDEHGTLTDLADKTPESAEVMEL